MSGIRNRWILVVVVVVALLAGGAGIAVATSASGHDNDQPLTGGVLQKARVSALAYTGGGTVTETESGDDGAAYSVEVRLANGREVEVNLDANFVVIGAEDEDDDGEDEGSDDDD
jgi:flagellar basal body-associated protein FliL